MFYSCPFIYFVFSVFDCHPCGFSIYLPVLCLATRHGAVLSEFRPTPNNTELLLVHCGSRMWQMLMLVLLMEVALEQQVHHVHWTEINSFRSSGQLSHQGWVWPAGKWKRLKWMPRVCKESSWFTLHCFGSCWSYTYFKCCISCISTTSPRAP